MLRSMAVRERERLSTKARREEPRAASATRRRPTVPCTCAPIRGWGSVC